MGGGHMARERERERERERRKKVRSSRGTAVEPVEKKL